MVIIVRNEHGMPSSNPGQAVCISHRTNTFGKYINQNILPLWVNSWVNYAF